MKKVCNIITTIAAVAFMLSLCSIDSNPLGSIIIMLITGAWVVGYSFVEEELKREEVRR